MLATNAALANVWLVDGDTLCDAALARRLCWLGSDEQARYQSFVRPLRRRQFLIGRILLRLALGSELGVPPERIALRERPANAPQLVWPQAQAGFSLAHSGVWVGCAVSAHTALGFDIEMRDPRRDILALSAQAFNHEQQVWLAAQTEPQRMAAFYQMWSEAEARFKLASHSGVQNGVCVTLAHPALSIVLCSARPLATLPTIDTLRWPD